jgi:hypothetical protein
VQRIGARILAVAALAEEHPGHNLDEWRVTSRSLAALVSNVWPVASISSHGESGIVAADRGRPGSRGDGVARRSERAVAIGGSALTIRPRVAAHQGTGRGSLIWGLYIRHLCLEDRKSRRLGLVRRGHQLAITRPTVSSLFDGDTEQSEAFSHG